MEAGGIAGTTVDLSLYPVDTVKTRLQASRGFAASGGFRGIYAGVGSALVGSAPGAALFFVTYETSKDLFRQLRQDAISGYNHEIKHYTGDSEIYAPPNTGIGWREAIENMLAASLGEVAACTVRVPTEVVKQRAQASQHPSSLATLRAILSCRTSLGLSAVWGELYRGWAITIFREVPFTVVQFPLWEALKKWNCKRNDSSEATTGESALFGCISGAVAAGLTTPLDVLKTRMMLSSEKQHLGTLARGILHEEGLTAFFAGLGPRVSWIAAGGAIFLGSYQLATNNLKIPA